MDRSNLVFVQFLLLVSVSLALKCSNTGFFGAKSGDGRKRDILLSYLVSNVTAEGGFYNASIGHDTNRLYGLTLCRLGYKTEDCSRCVRSQSQNLIKTCTNQTEAYVWDGDGDILCFVRYSNHSILGSLEVDPIDAGYNTGSFTSNITRFGEVWDGLVSRTLALASAGASSRIKYYASSTEALSAFENIYILMMCTPDIDPDDCNTCLQKSIGYYKACCYGNKGGYVSRPSCYFRWDLFPFHGAFDNITSTATPPRPPTVVHPSPGYKEPNQTTKKERRNMSSGTMAAIVSSVVVNILLLVALCRYTLCWKKSYEAVEIAAENTDMRTFRLDLSTVRVATNDFSPENKLGQGGFGVVYKGKLPNGKEIAVKRLSIHSGQGETEFKNEVLMLAGLQHRNLVNLLGFCLDGSEKLLIYEFVPNSSLDRFIFHPVKHSLLTWDIRYKLIGGIARGLLYLHEDSRLRIIHRDLKPGNILLDTEMNPKISDFGMARLFTAEETHGQASRIMGTYGYMAPEYIKHGQYSIKSDVYSFGILVLEIISGQKNNSFQTGLPAYAWKCWSKGAAPGIIDPVITNSSRNEIVRCIHIGLLCTQENVSRRPTMNSVVLWLSSDYASYSLPVPMAPAFLIQSNPAPDSSTSRQTKIDVGHFSTNMISETELDPR